MAAWPLAARAQQPPMPLIGFLGMDETEALRRPTGEAFTDRFREGLKAAGYVEGQNVTIDWRWANWQPAGVAPMVYDLLRRQAKVIVSAGGPIPAIAASVSHPRPRLFSCLAAIQSNLGSSPASTGRAATLQGDLHHQKP
jgi:putative ABC transport system substrate-binding protein